VSYLGALPPFIGGGWSVPIYIGFWNGDAEPEIWGFVTETAMSTESANPDRHQNRLINYDVIIRLDSDSTNRKDGSGQGKDVSDFIERKGWSSSYLNLGCFLLFEVCNSLVLLGLVFKPWV
jgi:hypothetical protein